jgi:hypothetical protein
MLIIRQELLPYWPHSVGCSCGVVAHAQPHDVLDSTHGFVPVPVPDTPDSAPGAWRALAYCAADTIPVGIVFAVRGS